MAELGFILLCLFTIGLAIGSFINVIIYRSIHKDSPLRGRSYCDNCKKQIAWYDNIPLISFIVLQQRCRYCKSPIPWQYPAVELITGALFVWWYAVGFTFFRLSAQPFSVIQPMFWLFIAVLFLIIFFTDINYYIIPDSAVLLLSFAVIGYRLLLTSRGIMREEDLFFSFIAGVGAFLCFLLLFLITRGKGMGFGDVKLAFPLGMILGWPLAIVGFMAAFVVGAAVGVTLIFFGKKKLKAHVPFGPFLIVGNLLALVWGEQLLSWYLSLL